MKPFSLCVIGDSHTAAVWRALKSGVIDVSPGFSVTVFAAQANAVDLMPRDGALFPDNPAVSKMMAYTSGGKDRIEIKAYDAFLVVGLGFGIDIGRAFGRYSIAEHLPDDSRAMVLSHTCLIEGFRAHAEKTGALQFVDDIRAETDVPILVYPVPFRPADPRAESDDPCLSNRPLLEDLVGRSMAALSELGRDHGCEVFWQHKWTVGQPGFTKPEFAVGAVNLRDSQEKIGKHVNPDFAVLCLRPILRRLDGLAPGSVLAPPKPAGVWQLPSSLGQNPRLRAILRQAWTACAAAFRRSAA
jgi:hypothetical protein